MQNNHSVTTVPIRSYHLTVQDAVVAFCYARNEEAARLRFLDNGHEALLNDPTAKVCAGAIVYDIPATEVG